MFEEPQSSPFNVDLGHKLKDLSRGAGFHNIRKEESRIISYHHSAMRISPPSSPSRSNSFSRALIVCPSFSLFVPYNSYVRVRFFTCSPSHLTHSSLLLLSIGNSIPTLLAVSLILSSWSGLLMPGLYRSSRTVCIR